MESGMPVLIHPLIVHFPIALWLTSALFDLLFLKRLDRFYFRVAHYLIGLGLLGALGSIITGFIDARPLVAEGIGQAFLDRHRVHQLVALLATAVYLLSFLIRWRRPDVGRWGIAVLLVAGAALTAATGWIGGEVRMLI